MTPMTPDEIIAASAILSETKVVRPPIEELPLDGDGLARLLQSAGLVNGVIDWQTQNFTGVTVEGEKASQVLARSLRDGMGDVGKRSANDVVANLVRQYIFRHWQGKTGRELTAGDFNSLKQAAIDWLGAQTKVRRHYVPCTLFGQYLPQITVGPVQFIHQRDLPSPSMGVSRADFWPDQTRKLTRRLADAWKAFLGQPWASEQPGQVLGRFYYEPLLRLGQERWAVWIAEIPVTGREEAQSIVVADLAASIAISALKLALPYDELRNMSRASEKAAPIWGANAWTISALPGGGTFNHQPGRTMSGTYISFALSKGAAVLASAGRRLESYVSGQRPLPRLNESWCSAAFWFHEALLEPVEAVAVAQLETAIEVLLSPGSSALSTQRLLSAFDAFLDMRPNDPLAPGSTVDVKSFVASIVTARSRVLHGTWSSLDPDLPLRGGLGVRRAEVEELARKVLLEATFQFDRYEAAGQQLDDISSFLSWVSANRPPALPAVGPLP
ncbi:hypothetical protein [Caulobacter segnis]